MVQNLRKSLLHLGLVVDFLRAEARQGATVLGLALQGVALGLAVAVFLLRDDWTLDGLLQLHIIEFRHCTFSFCVVPPPLAAFLLTHVSVTIETNMAWIWKILSKQCLLL